ncbi:MAG: hypothetical protein QOF64_2685 [Candidatus Binatota bacterium]|nr:hypothetical protein [Candidatus Binatota bacterium]
MARALRLGNNEIANGYILTEELLMTDQSQMETTMETTLGDLIVALTEETNRLVRNEKDAHVLVAYMRLDLLNHSAPTVRRWQ